MAKEHLLVVEDEIDIQEMIKYNLEKENYKVTAVTTGEEAIKVALHQAPNLIVLDLMLPEIDGFEVCRTLKNEATTSNIPIVMLTAKGEESDIVAGLELGAEDYITKPFSPRVLIARIRTVLRRRKKTSKTKDDVVEIKNMLIDSVRYEVRVEGETIPLTATEFSILQFLTQHPGWVFTRSQIIDNVKGSDYPVTDRSVDVQIVGLRKKLKSAGQYIETVRGVGYRFKE